MERIRNRKNVDKPIKVVHIQNHPPPRKMSRNPPQSLANFLKDFDYDNLEDVMDVVTVTMSSNWLMFLSKRQELFFSTLGAGKTPWPGPLLLLNLVTEEYVVSVFSQVARFGALDSGEAFYRLISLVFGPDRQLPCIGLNSSARSRGFSRLQFSPDCSGLCEDIKANHDPKRVAGRCLACTRALTGLAVSGPEVKKSGGKSAIFSEVVAESPAADNAGWQEETFVTTSDFGPLHDGDHCYAADSSTLDGTPAVRPTRNEETASVLGPIELPKSPVPVESLASLIPEPVVNTVHVVDKDMVRESFNDLLSNDDQIDIFGESAKDDEMLESSYDEALEEDIVAERDGSRQQVRSAEPSKDDEDLCDDSEKSDVGVTNESENQYSPMLDYPEVVPEYREMFHSLICTLCTPSKPLGTQAKFFAHMRSEHKLKTAQCPECLVTFIDRLKVFQHEKKYHFRGLFNCVECTSTKAQNALKKKNHGTFKCAKEYVRHMHEEHSDSQALHFKMLCPSCKETRDCSKLPTHDMDFPNHYLACYQKKKRASTVLHIRRRDQLFKEGKLPESQIFTCEHCSKRFCRSDRYKNHLATHTRAFRFLCDECPFGASTQFELASHKTVHAVAKGEKSALVCQFCGSTAPDENRMNNHMQAWHPVEHALNKYGCQDCQDGFDDAETLKTHMLTEHYDDTHGTEKCCICPKLLTSKSKLSILHYVTAHLDSQDPVYHDHMLRKFSMSLHNGTGKFRRRVFGPNTSSSRRMKRIVVSSCQDCAQDFSSLKELHRHMDCMHQDQKIKCKECDYSGWQHNLYAHVQQVHRNPSKDSPRATCEVCGTRVRKQIMEAHMRQHTGEKPFKCSDCDMAYTTKSSLRTHYKIKHLGLPAPVSKARQMASRKGRMGE